MKIEFTEEELMTIRHLCDYKIASRDKKSPQASGRGGIIAKAEALLEKVEKILSEIVEKQEQDEERAREAARNTPIERYKRAKAALNSLKGVGNQPIEEYLKELKDLNERIMDIIHTRKTGIGSIDLIHQVMPESFGKTGSDLDPYEIKFNDAMNMFSTGLYLSDLSAEQYKKLIEEFQPSPPPKVRCDGCATRFRLDEIKKDGRPTRLRKFEFHMSKGIVLCMDCWQKTRAAHDYFRGQSKDDGE